jgi:hypothetical protein
MARIMTYRASLDRPRFSRLSELMDKRNRVGATRDEDEELVGLFSGFPHLEHPPFVDAYHEAYRLAARSYVPPSELAKLDARPKSAGEDPYWAAARMYRRADDARNKPKR